MEGNLERRSGVGFLIGLNVLALATGLLMGAASAQGVGTTATPSAEPEKQTRRAKAAPLAGRKVADKVAGQPFIEFRSRFALSYGHTFVVFGRLNARGEISEIKPDMVAGLHPAGDSSFPWMVGHVAPVPAETGWSDGDLEEEYVSNRFRLLLSDAQYAELLAHVRHKQANSPVWHAVLYNCNLWVGEIAQFLGLETGFHWLPPTDFIGEIKNLNSGDPRSASALSKSTSRVRSQYLASTASVPSSQSQEAAESLPSTGWSDASLR